MADKRVLVIGSGGREHAIVRKLVASDQVGTVTAMPGNPGIAEIGECVAGSVDDADAIERLAEELKPDLIVIGPENPIAAGVGDRLTAVGHRVFAPSRSAARLEWSKSFAKDFMERHNVPTARHRRFSANDLEEALAYLTKQSMPIVLKAEGLTAGKGVVIATTVEEARREIKRMLTGERFGDAASVVLVEEFMAGEEASIFVISDGDDYIVLAPSQDHKRVGDGDTGPNTGGMGAYAPAPVVTGAVFDRVERDIIRPTLAGMRADGTPFVGCLYVGIMIDDSDMPRVVEFNCRFGDPETQVILPIWGGDLYELFERAVDGRLGDYTDPGSTGAAACICVASGGYPGSYEKGKAIEGLPAADSQPGVHVDHAGTTIDSSSLVTAGGRVLGVVGTDNDGDLSRAVDRSYEGVAAIAFEGMIFRTDIASRALTRR